MKRPDQIKNAPDQGMGDRVPPGQFLTKKFPVLTYGSTPKIDMDTWKMRVFGLVAQEVELSWEQFGSLGWTTVTADFHCVTQWSCLDNTWEGIPVSALAALVQPKPEARFLMAHCFGGYSANLPLDLVMDEGLLVHKHNGEVLGEGHGWPLRLIVPSRYGWKSAKWVNGIEFMAEDAPGFWEQRGYNNNGDPWLEERFWPELSR